MYMMSSYIPEDLLAIVLVSVFGVVVNTLYKSSSKSKDRCIETRLGRLRRPYKDWI